MTTVRIDVTLADIAKGRRCGCTDCPIARAAARVLRRRMDGVTCGVIHLIDGTELPLPEAALSFIRAFDSGCAVEPFAFDVEAP